ncbi:LysR family transcriptional regulator [Holophaga foetida]|uniref:LysR family transcriptional regulator n=1 Tax=Holophaga foetida TaxID=35839 RepID=UPI0002473AFB|nr:LysR substrate-binding domain-containing protein [Holophaga foetida]
MDIRHLDIFVTIAECRTFTEAAKRLSITQASVSYQVAEMEKRLSMRLFIRDRASVRLTSAGVILYEGGKKILATMGDLIEEARSADEGRQGSLRMGYVGSLEPFLSEAMRRLHREHPAIDLSPERLNMEDICVALLADKLDIAITYDIGLIRRPDVQRRTLFTDTTQVVMSLDHPLASRNSLSLKDLVEVPLVLISREASGASRQWLLNQFAQAGGVPGTILEAATPESLLLRVESGLGVTLLARQVLENMPQFKVRCIPLEEELPVDTVVLWKEQNGNPCIPMFLRALEI